MEGVRAAGVLIRPLIGQCQDQACAKLEPANRLSCMLSFVHLGELIHPYCIADPYTPTSECRQFLVPV